MVFPHWRPFDHLAMQKLKCVDTVTAIGNQQTLINPGAIGQQIMTHAATAQDRMPDRDSHTGAQQGSDYTGCLAKEPFPGL